jgi:hypothetical protein
MLVEASGEQGGSELLVGLAADAIEFSEFGGKASPLSLLRLFFGFFGCPSGCDFCSGFFSCLARADVSFDRFAAFFFVTVVVPFAVDPFPCHFIYLASCRLHRINIV